MLNNQPSAEDLDRLPTLPSFSRIPIPLHLRNHKTHKETMVYSTGLPDAFPSSSHPLKQTTKMRQSTLFDCLSASRLKQTIPVEDDERTLKSTSSYESERDMLSTPSTELEEVTMLKDSIHFKYVSHATVTDLRRLNSVVIPVTYKDSFYRDLCERHPPQLSRLGEFLFSFLYKLFQKMRTDMTDSAVNVAYDGRDCIGAICCRKEPLSTGLSGRYRVYVMTIGVLAPYRRLRIGSKLLHTIILEAKADPSIDHLCLHVHVENTEALQFYLNNGFNVAAREQGYYRSNVGIVPPDAYRLQLDCQR